MFLVWGLVTTAKPHTEDFQKRILVATDLFGRGIDIERATRRRRALRHNEPRAARDLAGGAPGTAPGCCSGGEEDRHLYQKLRSQAWRFWNFARGGCFSCSFFGIYFYYIYAHCFCCCVFCACSATGSSSLSCFQDFLWDFIFGVIREFWSFPPEVRFRGSFQVRRFLGTCSLNEHE